MDPWVESGSCSVSCALKTPEGLNFEDNFSPSIRDTLPDSEQYLASLEEKLRKLKSDPNVLKQLTEKREACMQNFLNGDFNSPQFENENFDAPVASNSQIIRAILPQKQALNKGEIVELVEYDQLSGSESD